MQGVNQLTISRQIDIKRTPRLMQMEGLFDVAPSQHSQEQWTVNLALPESWNVGLIVGPSGCGKTTIARELFGQYMMNDWTWPEDKSILDGFPVSMSIKEIVELLSSVGFSSPPSWVRPFHVLSNGEQFRVNMARTLAESKELAVVDEFTSVVDRTVAQIGSAAIAKTVRRRNQRFIAVSCHYDIAEWLEPDWMYEPATDTLTVGRLLQRPKIELTVKRVHSSAWQLFRKHHYLDTNLNSSARCFVAFWRDVPVAFIAWLHLVHKIKNIKRVHRIVCLPDYQGVGIGKALQEYTAAMLRVLGYRATITSSHPAVIGALTRSTKWRMTGNPKRNTGGGMMFRDKRLSKTIAWNRFVAGFEYVGPAMDKTQALALWQG